MIQWKNKSWECKEKRAGIEQCCVWTCAHNCSIKVNSIIQYKNVFMGEAYERKELFSTIIGIFLIILCWSLKTDLTQVYSTHGRKWAYYMKY